MRKVELFYHELNEMLVQSFGVEKSGFAKDVTELSISFYKGKKTVSKFKGEAMGFFNDNVDVTPYILCFNILGDDKLNLQLISALRPNEGIGSSIMRMIVTTANKHNIKLRLDAVPSLGMADKSNWDVVTDRLINFYKRFGFESWHKKEPFKMRNLVFTK